MVEFDFAQFDLNHLRIHMKEDCLKHAIVQSNLSSIIRTAYLSILSSKSV